MRSNTLEGFIGFFISIAVLVLPSSLSAAAADSELQHSIDQLRSSVGQWDVTTSFLGPDGTVAKSVSGTYEFSWVVPDRVVSGRSEIPELGQSSALLFYVNEAKRLIEMVSVGADGQLWVMTGPLGGEVRMTPEFPTASGGKGMLRFTRFNVSPDAFESRMEYSDDGGTTWKPGNRQVFKRTSKSAMTPT